MSLCKRNLTPLQRRFMQQMSGAMILTVLTNLSTPSLPNPLVDLIPALSRLNSAHGHPSLLVASLLSAFAVLPILLAIWVMSRYLKSEPDEFIRALVVRAILWGVAVTMAGDAIAGTLMTFYAHSFPLAILNADLFVISTGLAFSYALRSYQ